MQWLHSLGTKKALSTLASLIAVGEPIFSLGAGRRDVHRVGLAVDARLVLAVQFDIALDPGAEMVRVAGDVVFSLAGFDAAQAADAFGGIDAKGPLVLVPIVAGDRRGRRRARRGLRFLRQHGARRHRGGATGNRNSQTFEKGPARGLPLPQLLVFSHFECPPDGTPGSALVHLQVERA